MIPELIGRLPVYGALQNLSKKDLKNILFKPKNSMIKQYQAIFAMENIQLEFTDKAIEMIINRAIQLKTGARGCAAA